MRGRTARPKKVGNALTKAPKPPDWLTGFSKAEWDRIMPILIYRRVLTVADIGTVENYCLAFGRIREIEIMIRQTRSKEHGPNIDRHVFAMWNNCMATCKQYATELGLTPASREKPKPGEADIEYDPLLDF